MSTERANLPEQRRRRIVMRLREAGSVTVAGLEKELGISAATARRDLAVLEGEGKAKRTHGGAVPPGLAARGLFPAASRRGGQGQGAARAGGCGVARGGGDRVLRLLDHGLLYGAAHAGRCNGF